MEMIAIICALVVFIQLPFSEAEISCQRVEINGSQLFGVIAKDDMKGKVTVTHIGQPKVGDDLEALFNKGYLQTLFLAFGDLPTGTWTYKVVTAKNLVKQENTTSFDGSLNGIKFTLNPKFQ